MKQTKMFCNICREERENQVLTCIYWKSDIMPQGWATSNNLNASDIHICDECVVTVKTIPAPDEP